ncbi:hypothetical protein ABFX02_14G204700 [Erythranthe guttata]
MERKPSISDHQPRNTRRRIETPVPAETYLEDHVEEILSRLPVKSLSRFRCVSKSWRALISSNHFIKARLELSRKDTTNFTTRHVIVSTSTPPGGIRLKHCSLPPLFCGLVADSSDVDLPITNRIGSVCVRGSCNGLVCVVIDKKHIYLWNPSTRKFKELPHADADADADSNSDDTTKAIIGFGFAESNEDYKVLAVFNVGRDETNVKIYSLRTNSWKRIDVFKDGLPFSETGTFVSGKIHWSRRKGSDSRGWDIVSLEVGSEVCGTVAQPSYVESDLAPWFGLFGGCLCVFYHHPKIGVDVWVLKEYGVTESWTKTVTVPYIHDPGEGRPDFKPLCIGPKGKILVVYGQGFLIYSPKDYRFRLTVMRNACPFLEADVYYESLVSPSLLS